MRTIPSSGECAYRVRKLPFDQQPKYRGLVLPFDPFQALAKVCPQAVEKRRNAPGLCFTLQRLDGR